MNVMSATTSLVGLQALGVHQRATNAAMERLATGKRINRYSDDPAGAVAAERLAVQKKDIAATIDKRERAGFILGAIDNGARELTDMFQELDSLVLRASNRGGLSPEELESMQTQAEGILKGIAFTIQNTEFNGQFVLRDTTTLDLGGTVQVFQAMGLDKMGRVSAKRDVQDENGETKTVTDTVSLEDMFGFGAINLVNGDLEAAHQAVESALDGVIGLRGRIGGLFKYTLGSEADRLRAEFEAVSAAESQIVDADFAKEVTELTRSQAMEQAAATVIGIAQHNAMSTLQLVG